MNPERHGTLLAATNDREEFGNFVLFLFGTPALFRALVPSTQESVTPLLMNDITTK